MVVVQEVTEITEQVKYSTTVYIYQITYSPMPQIRFQSVENLFKPTPQVTVALQEIIREYLGGNKITTILHTNKLHNQISTRSGWSSVWTLSYRTKKTGKIRLTNYSKQNY